MEPEKTEVATPGEEYIDKTKCGIRQLVTAAICRFNQTDSDCNY